MEMFLGIFQEVRISRGPILGPQLINEYPHVSKITSVSNCFIGG